MVDFGDVKSGETRNMTIVFQNKGKRPIHYTLSKLSCPGLSIDSVGGVVFPGLRIVVRVQLAAGESGLLIDSLDLKTPFGEIAVPVMANVLVTEKEVPAD
jgi:hypothetical protein